MVYCTVCLPQSPILNRRIYWEFERTFAVPSTAVFWTQTSDDVVPGNCWSQSSSLPVTTLSSLTTTGTTLAFTFHILSCSSFRLWYFLVSHILSSWSCCHLVRLHLSPQLSSGPCQLPQCLLIAQYQPVHLDLTVPHDLSPVITHKPLWAWEVIVYMIQMFLYTVLLLGCVLQWKLFLHVSYILPLCVGLSLQPLCRIYTLITCWFLKCTKWHLITVIPVISVEIHSQNSPATMISHILKLPSWKTLP